MISGSQARGRKAEKTWMNKLGIKGKKKRHVNVLEAADNTNPLTNRSKLRLTVNEI